MHIAAARESDLPEIVEMLCLAFERGLDNRFRSHLYEDCTYQLHQSRVGKVDGKVVSYARVSNRPIRIGREVVAMGGIGAVSTHPDYRGRGYNTLILQDAIRYMEERDYDLSMLFTGISGHYGKLGWVTFPEHSITIAPASVPGATGERSQPPFRLRESAPPAQEGWAVRPLDEAEDLPDVIRIYDEHNRQRTGTATRTPDYWRCGHSRVMGVLPNLVVERDGRLAAYLKCSITAQAMTVPEVGYLLDEPEAVWAMARYLLNHVIEKEVRQITFRLGRLHPLPEVLCEISNGRMSHSEGEGMMLRLIHFPELLRKIAPELRRRLKRSGFADAEAEIAFHVGEHRAVLSIARGKVRVGTEGKARTTLALSARPMLRMLLGDATFGQMAALNRAHGVRPPARIAALLDALFPLQDPVYWGCDHF